MVNYVCIDYPSCQLKTLRIISSNIIFKQTIFNILLVIGIPEMLMNLVYCHGFMEKPNATVILTFRYHLVNNHLAKGFFTIEKNYNQLSVLTNDAKLRIHAIDKLETDFVI